MKVVGSKVSRSKVNGKLQVHVVCYNYVYCSMEDVWLFKLMVIKVVGCVSTVVRGCWSSVYIYID